MIIARGLLVLVLFCRMRPWFYGLLHEMRDNIIISLHGSDSWFRVRFPDAARDIARGIRDGSLDLSSELLWWWLQGMGNLYHKLHCSSTSEYTWCAVYCTFVNERHV